MKKLRLKFWRKKSKPEETEENLFDLEQLPVIEIPEDPKQSKVKDLSQKAILYFGKGVNTATNTGEKVKTGLTDSTKFIKGKYEEMVIKPKLIALLNKTDTEKLLSLINSITLPASITPKTLVAAIILKNFVLVLDKYKKGLESKEETQSELNALFSQIEMKDVLALTIPIITEFHPKSGKVLNRITALMFSKK